MKPPEQSSPRSEDALNQQREELEQHIHQIGEQLIQSSKPAPITWKGLEGIEESIERFNEAVVAFLSEAISPEFIASLEALAKEAEQHPPWDPQKAARRRAREDLAEKRRALRRRKGKL